MAGVASIWNFQAIRFTGRNKSESVAANINIRNLLLDSRHMAAHAFITSAPGLVMRVRLNGNGVRPVWRIRPMTFQAHHIGRFQQISIVFRAVDIVAAIAADTVRIHGALHEIVALHSVFVRRAVRKMRESLLLEFVFFQLPIIL